jgi:hypothetical protein
MELPRQVRLLYAIGGCCVASISLLTTPIYSSAQPLVDTNPSDFLVWQKAQEYTITNEDDKSIIPDSVYYEAIFREILKRRPDYLSHEDWELINGLPSHLDSSFTAWKHRSLLDMCARLAIIGSDDEIIDIASAYSVIQSNDYILLNRHYEQFLLKLSSPTRQQILALKKGYMDGNQFGFSKMDMVGLAADSPSAAKALLDNGCAAIERIGEVDFETEKRLMSDEQIPALPMFGPIGN